MNFGNIWFWLTYDFNALKGFIWIGLIGLIFILLPIWTYQEFYSHLDRWNLYFDNVEIVGIISGVTSFIVWGLILRYINGRKKT